MEYQVEPLKSDELYDLAILFEDVWGTGLENFHKKTDWAFGNSHSKMLVARKDGRIIGSRGATEWPLIYNSQEIKSLQFHDTCVHPDYQRKGIISKLNREFLEKYSHGYDLIFNISVDASRKAYEKLGWNYLDGFRRLTLFSNSLKVIRNRAQPVVPENSISQPVNVNSVFDDELLSERRKLLNNLISVDYNIPFLEWRLSNTSTGYRCSRSKAGLCIYKIQKKGDLKELIIGDIFLYKYHFKTFKVMLKDLIHTESPDITYTYLFKNHPFYSYYLRSFFLVNPLRLNLNFGTKILSGNLPEDTILSKKFAVSAFDLDTF